MSDEIEYDCPDCGHHVIAFGFYGLTEPGMRCSPCVWVREHVPPERQTEIRELLGVPLVALAPPETADNAPGGV